jgi:hypothetical protein
VRANAIADVELVEDELVHVTLDWPEHPYKPGVKEPIHNQRWFADYDTLPQRFRLFLAGIGAGKTLTGAQTFIQAAMENPGCTGLVVGREMKMVSRVQEKALIDACTRYAEENGFEILAKHNKTSHILVLVNGFTIHCVGAEEPEGLRGPNITLIWADEITTWSKEMQAMKILRGRLRGEGKITKFRLFLVTCTPKGPRGAIMNWARRCKTEIAPGVKIGTGKFSEWLFCHMGSADNDALPDDYVEELFGEYDPEFAKQELGGEITSVHGKVYSDLVSLDPWPYGSVVKFDFDPFKHELHCAIDWGLAYPHVLWIAHDPSETVRRGGLPDVIIDELCLDNISDDEVIDTIKAQEGQWGRPYKQFYPDPRGVSENRKLAEAYPHVPMKRYTQAHLVSIRWGVYVVRGRILNGRGDRRLAISDQLLSTPGNMSPEGRGIVNGLLNYDYVRHRDGKAKDKFKDDSWYIHGCDALRYYLTHQYPLRNTGPLIA